MAYNVKNYTEQGGEKTVIGGTLEVKDGATVTGITVAEGGASNLTCRVEIQGVEAHAICLRIQRERGIFEPYDVVIMKPKNTSW